MKRRHLVVRTGARGPVRAGLAVAVLAAVLVLAPARPAHAAGAVGLSTDYAVFGDQFFGAVAPQYVTVFSSGDAPLTVSALTWRGDGASHFYAVTDCLGESVPQGETCEIAIFFVPRNSGRKFAELVLAYHGQETSISVRGSAFQGYYLAGPSGSITGLGAARKDLRGFTQPLNRPVVGMASTSTGEGVWLVAGDGGVFSFGDAEFHGSTGAIRLNQPVVGIAATPTGEGYWLVASDGGVFAFGDAGFYGSTGAIRLNQPVVGIAATPTGEGYWLVAADGGIFAFGDAPFHGSTGAIRLNQPVVGIAATPTGDGYWFVARDGGIFAFGDAGFYGAYETPTTSVVGMAASPSGNGYAIASSSNVITYRGDSLAGGDNRMAPPEPSIAIVSAGSPALSIGGTVDSI